MARNHDTAPSRLLLLVNTVLDSETSCLHRIVQDSGILVVSYTAQEDGRVGRQKVLGATSGVLGSSSSDQLGRVVVEQVFVDSEVLFFSEDGVVGF
jgi:hypothetical protein